MKARNFCLRTLKSKWMGGQASYFYLLGFDRSFGLRLDLEDASARDVCSHAFYLGLLTRMTKTLTLRRFVVRTRHRHSYS